MHIFRIKFQILALFATVQKNYKQPFHCSIHLKKLVNVLFGNIIFIMSKNNIQHKFYNSKYNESILSRNNNKPQPSSFISNLNIMKNFDFARILSSDYLHNIKLSVTVVMMISFVTCIKAQCPSTSLGGQVFRDDDTDGTKDPSEIGIAMFPVEVYDVNGIRVCNTLTNATGNWTCTGLIAGEQYRVEFRTEVLIATPGFIGPNSSGNVVNTTAGTCTVNYAAFDPAYVCEMNPDLAMVCSSDTSGES